MPEAYTEDDPTEYYDELISYATKRTKDREDAKDLVHDTYVKAYKKADQYEEGTNLRSWLYTVMKNTHINQLRRMDKENLRSDPDNSRAIEEGWWAKSEVSEYKKGIPKKIQDAFSEIAPKFRRVAILVGLHDFEYKEVAYILGVPVGTVMSRLYRARNKLEPKLKSYAEKEYGM